MAENHGKILIPPLGRGYRVDTYSSQLVDGRPRMVGTPAHHDEYEWARKNAEMLSRALGFPIDDRTRGAGQ